MYATSYNQSSDYEKHLSLIKGSAASYNGNRCAMSSRTFPFSHQSHLHRTASSSDMTLAGLNSSTAAITPTNNNNGGGNLHHHNSDLWSGTASATSSPNFQQNQNPHYGSSNSPDPADTAMNASPSNTSNIRANSASSGGSSSGGGGGGSGCYSPSYLYPAAYAAGAMWRHHYDATLSRSHHYGMYLPSYNDLYCIFVNVCVG